MPDFLHLKSDEVDTMEKRGKYFVNIIGCGQRGIIYAIEFAKAGYKVIGTDADQSVVRRLSKGKMPNPAPDAESKLKIFLRNGRLTFTSDAKSAVAQSDIIVLTIATKMDLKKSANYSEIEASGKQVGAALRTGTLVIYGGIASLGLMERIIKEKLENTSGLKAGKDFGLAYNPIFTLDGDNFAESFSGKKLTVAANDENSAKSAAIVLATLTAKSVEQYLDFETVELATLFAVARRDLNVALSNEFAMFCESAGKDYFKTLVTDMGPCEMNPSPKVAGRRLNDEVYLLLENAENFDTKLRLTSLARQINEGMSKHVTSLVQDALRNCGKSVRRARITILSTLRPTPSVDDLINLLEAKGAKTTLYGPPPAQTDSLGMKTTTRRNLFEAAEGSDCVVILTANSQLSSLNLKNLRTVMRAPAAIVDLARVLVPDEVVKEGFIYRGLGRGVEKK